MKFAWHLLTIDNLWTKFFRAKYIKTGHLCTTYLISVGSRIWKAILEELPRFMRIVSSKFEMAVLLSGLTGGYLRAL